MADSVQRSAVTGWPSRLSSRLLQGRFARAVAKMAGGNGVIQLLGIATSPIMSRVFAPEETGTASVFLSLTAIFSGIACLRYDQAIPLAGSREQRLDVMALCLRIVPFTACLLLALAIVGSHSFSRLLNSPKLESYLWLLPIAVLLTASVQVLANWFTREHEFGTIVRVRLRQSMGQISFQLGGGALTHGSTWILLWGAVLGNALAASLYLMRLRSVITALWQRIRTGALRSVAWNYRQFPIFNSWSAIVDSLGHTLPVFAMTALHGTSEAGWLRMAQTLVILPVVAIAGAVANVYWAEAAKLAVEAPDRIGRLYLRMTLYLAAGGGALILGSLLLPSLVPIIFGQRWAPAGNFAVILAFPAACSLTCAPAVNLSTLGFNHWEAGWVVFRLVLTGTAVVLAHTLGLGPLPTLAALAAALVVGYLALIALNFLAIHRFVARKGNPD